MSTFNEYTYFIFMWEKKVSKIEHVIPFKKNIKQKELKLNLRTTISKYRYLKISTTKAISISKVMSMRSNAMFCKFNAVIQVQSQNHLRLIA